MKTGNQTQSDVYRLLNKYKLLQILRDYTPILVGTVPIGINIQTSDLDIICEVKNFVVFEIQVREQFEHFRDFSLIRREVEGMERIKVNFMIERWPIEIFGQNKPTDEQNGYLHMVIEDRMLKLFGLKFKEQIIKLKIEGLKTEPAFARLLQLDGDPYLKLLQINKWSDEELRDLWVDLTMNEDT